MAEDQEEKMTTEQFTAICDLTVRLTELRLKGCGHLCIENYAPELLAKLLGAFRSDLSYKVDDPRFIP